MTRAAPRGSAVPASCDRWCARSSALRARSRSSSPPPTSRRDARRHGREVVPCAAVRRLGHGHPVERDPTLPLRIAEATPAGAFGIVEYVCRSAPTLCDALSQWCRYLRILDDAVEVGLVDTLRAAGLAPVITESEAPAPAAHELCFALVARHARAMLDGISASPRSPSPTTRPRLWPRVIARSSTRPSASARHAPSSCSPTRSSTGRSSRQTRTSWRSSVRPRRRAWRASRRPRGSRTRCDAPSGPRSARTRRSSRSSRKARPHAPQPPASAEGRRDGVPGAARRAPARPRGPLPRAGMSFAEISSSSASRSRAPSSGRSSAGPGLRRSSGGRRSARGSLHPFTSARVSPTSSTHSRSGARARDDQ